MKMYNRPDAIVYAAPDCGKFAVCLTDQDGETLVQTTKEVYELAGPRDVVWASIEDASRYYSGSKDWTGETYDWGAQPDSMTYLESYVWFPTAWHPRDQYRMVRFPRPWGK
jgi:hypothetical protein